MTHIERMQTELEEMVALVKLIRDEWDFEDSLRLRKKLSAMKKKVAFYRKQLIEEDKNFREFYEIQGY